jgi:hypothetical protein
MLYLFRLLFFLINIKPETDVSWFEIEDNPDSGIVEASRTLNHSFNLSISTLSSLMEGFWNKFQDGLTIVDIENSLFFILFVRFLILAIRYNLKTSFYITSIGLVAGYLWYRHLLDIISANSNVLVKIPFLQNFGQDAIQLVSMDHRGLATNSKVGENTHWYNPGQVIYSGIMRAIVNIDPETGKK